MRKPRFAKQYLFWLNLEDGEQYQIAECIEQLKEKRSFSQTIRDGIRLIVDLSQGKTDVLQELFPWVLEGNNVPERVQAGSVDSRGHEAALRAQIDRLESLLLQQGATPLPLPARSSLSDLKPADEGLEIQVSAAGKREDNNPSMNFMIASALNIYGTCDRLPPEIIEYGLRTGRIKSEMMAQKDTRNTRQNNGGNAKVLAVSEFAPPDPDALGLALDGW